MGKLKITIFFLAFLTLVVVGHASYTIWSNQLTDNVSAYGFNTVTKDSTGGFLYSNVTFHGTLMLGPVPTSGVTVNLYGGTNPDNATWTLRATNTTDVSGDFRFTINRTEVGLFYYGISYLVTP